MENVDQMKFKNQKQSDIRSFFKSSNLFYLWCLLVLYEKKILFLNLCCLFLPKKPKTLYNGHLVIADTFFSNRMCPL